MRSLDLKAVGQRVRARRKELDLSQETVSQQLGGAQSWLSNIEQGNQTRLEADTLYRLAVVLHCGLDYLAGLVDDPTPPKRTRRRRAAASEPEEEAQAVVGV